MNIFGPAVEVEAEGDVLVDVMEEPPYEVIVRNDDFNSFEHVIQCFMLFCAHTEQMAERSATIIHTTGKCTVKTGPKSEMETIVTSLCAQGLDAIVREQEQG